MDKKPSPWGKEIDELIERVRVENPALFASIAGFLAGCQLMLDDVKDYGQFSTPEHPSPFHHWIWGALLMLISTGGLGFAMLDIMSKLPPPSKRPPQGLIEQGIPLDFVRGMR